MCVVINWKSNKQNHRHKIFMRVIFHLKSRWHSVRITIVIAVGRSRQMNAGILTNNLCVDAPLISVVQAYIKLTACVCVHENSWIIRYPYHFKDEIKTYSQWLCVTWSKVNKNINQMIIRKLNYFNSMIKQSNNKQVIKKMLGRKLHYHIKLSENVFFH